MGAGTEVASGSNPSVGMKGQCRSSDLPGTKPREARGPAAWEVKIQRLILLCLTNWNGLHGSRWHVCAVKLG